MKRTLFSLAFASFAAVSLPANACINESGTNQQGLPIKPFSYAGEHLKAYLFTPTSTADLIERSEHVVAMARKSPTFNNLNDLAAVLIRHGRLPEAVKLLTFLERKYPGHYQTASNLGTAYELMGLNEDALKWILVGMERNADDHHGTEWLHALILKAKLGRIPMQESAYSILNLDFGKGAMPQRPKILHLGNAGKTLTLFDLGLALRYQLKERVALVAAPDPIVAGLLLEWANLELVAGTVESANVLYDAAVRYESKETRLIALRKTQVARILAEAKSKRTDAQGDCELCFPPRPSHK